MATAAASDRLATCKECCKVPGAFIDNSFKSGCPKSLNSAKVMLEIKPNKLPNKGIKG